MRSNNIVYRQGSVTLTIMFRNNGSIEIEVSTDTENEGELIEDITLDKSDVIDVVMEWLRNI